MMPCRVLKMVNKDKVFRAPATIQPPSPPPLQTVEFYSISTYMIQIETKGERNTDVGFLSGIFSPDHDDF